MTLILPWEIELHHNRWQFSGHSFISTFLQEIWIIAISIFCFWTSQPQLVLNFFLFFTKFSFIVLIMFVLIEKSVYVLWMLWFATLLLILKRSRVMSTSAFWIILFWMIYPVKKLFIIKISLTKLMLLILFFNCLLFIFSWKNEGYRSSFRKFNMVHPLPRFDPSICFISREKVVKVY